jgi:uncharacterized NAD(P)/FAD-binding protein YdhS
VNVIIIGSGFSGTMVAVHLARQTRLGVDVTVVERTGRFGAGVAYSTPYACHLLNVPAARMSAFADDANHFLRWAVSRDAAVRADAFLPRQWYSAYLADILDAAKSNVSSRTSLRRIDSEATGLTRDVAGRWHVLLRDGQSLIADVVVLAIGNFPPANPHCETPSFYESDGYRRDPWGADALTVDARDDVLLLGTGLTMIDVAVALTDQGHRGQITAVSRRGLLPQWLSRTTRAPTDVPAPSGMSSWRRTARGLLKGVRQAVAECGELGGDWRDVVASLRAVTPSLWTSLPIRERKRFLRHVRPYWDTHRHGAAPAIGHIIDGLRQTGRLRTAAGRVLRYDVEGGDVVATMQSRGARSTERVRVQRVINCTGPDANMTRVPSPLVRDLHDRGMMCPDPLGIGIVTDDIGCVVDRAGAAQRGLYLVGPLKRGQTWENIAVPELREGAQRLADHLTPSLRTESVRRSTT